MKTLAELRAALADALKRWDTALAEFESATDENREERAASLHDAEVAHATAASEYDRREAFEEAKRNLPVEVAGAAADIRVKSEPLTYRKGGEHSFLLDQFAASKGDSGAHARLERHMIEMVSEDIVTDAEVRALNETAGTGGEIVAPLYWQDQFLDLARAGRVYVDALTQIPLPPLTNTINIPKLTTGTATATQQDGGAVQSTDLATGNLSYPVITIAGMQDFARQLWDRSDPGLTDAVVFPDLIADYNTKFDVQAINGSGTGGNAKGVLNAAGILTRTYTDATPTLAELYKKIAAAISDIHTQRFMPPTAIVMHPRRWAFCLAEVDSTGRPLVLPQAGGGMNLVGNLANVAAQGVVGNMLGLPVIVDPSIPTTLGAGTNEDRIIVQRLEDSFVHEDQPIKTKVFEEVLSGTLSVRAQVFNYAALTHERRPKGICVISGDGLITPTF